jgi:hypothetical protein
MLDHPGRDDRQLFDLMAHRLTHAEQLARREDMAAPAALGPMLDYPISLPTPPAMPPHPLNAYVWRFAGFSSTRPERFELPTFGSVDRRSIQLSYGRRARSLPPL